MVPSRHELLVWITRRIRAGFDDELLDWPAEKVESTFRAALPPELWADGLAALEERRRQRTARQTVA